MSTANVYEVIRAPRVSEKTARLQEVSNQYVFEIAKTATKADVKAAGERLAGGTIGAELRFMNQPARIAEGNGFYSSALRVGGGDVRQRHQHDVDREGSQRHQEGDQRDELAEANVRVSSAGRGGSMGHGSDYGML